jgi:NAD(P)-dependent dehydrogenase (short-subunit alcohol dehydrogenase family)
MNQFSGKVMLVTGGGQGLGAAICKSLAADGAVVIPTDVKADKLRGIVDQITASGGKAHGYTMDVTNEHQVAEVVERIVADHGRLDVVINNAGVDFTKPIEELSFEEWDTVMKVNLRGPFVVSKLTLAHLAKTGGHIVNIASTAAKRAWPNASAYHASKWGVLGFSHALHTEARKQRVKVTAVLAGGMQTPFILDRFPDTPLENLQDPKNVADTIKYVLMQPAETVIPEVMVVPMTETSWP